MPRLFVLVITVASSSLLWWKMGALAEARFRLGELRARARQVEDAREQARRLEAAQKQKMARNVAEAARELERVQIEIEQCRAETGLKEGNIAELNRRLEEGSEADQSINAYLTERGKACASTLRKLNAKPTVLVPQDTTEIEQFRELLRAKNLERKFEALNDIASIFGVLSLFEKSAVRLSYFYNGWLMEALGDDFPKDESVRLALERRFGESIAIGVGVIFRSAGEQGGDALRKAVFDEIDESVLKVLAEGKPDYNERIHPRIQALAFQDPMIGGIYKPLHQFFYRD